MNYKDLLKGMESAAKESGEFILEEKGKVSAGDIEIKSLNSLVSYVDTTAEQQIVSSLSSLLPEAGFITEEGTAAEKGDRFNWVIDPLDGTTNYLHGITPFAVSIALMEENTITAGVIYELGQKELFKAALNQGAYLNGRQIRVSSNQQMEDSFIATGFPYYDFKRTEEFLKLLHNLFENTRGVRRLGSAATDMAYVACGRFDAFFEYGLSSWDVAAGDIILREAGGKVSDFKGEDDYIFGGEIVCGSPFIQPLLLESVQHTMH